jgi:hypothetical protein
VPVAGVMHRTVPFGSLLEANSLEHFRRCQRIADLGVVTAGKY